MENKIDVFIRDNIWYVDEVRSTPTGKFNTKLISLDDIQKIREMERKATIEEMQNKIAKRKQHIVRAKYKHFQGVIIENEFNHVIYRVLENMKVKQ